MFTSGIRFGTGLIVLGMLLLQSGCAKSRDVVRPEKIVSMRQVFYDTETYAELAKLWKEYYDVFPSEDAYANWMYATRYATRGNKAEESEYKKLLKKGLNKYSANPVLLYLSGILYHGAPDYQQDLGLLERAAKLEPTYNDPWFAMTTIYMRQGDEEKLDLALRRLIEGEAVSEEVMDYNYNVLSGLAENAILFTNGDNDTYPGWILQRIIKFRPDVKIVNRSLLNTDWYPLYLFDHGLVRFMSREELTDFRERRMTALKESGESIPAGGPFGDSLIVKITNSAKGAGIPVYFALTMYDTEILKPLKDAGEMLGLAIRVTPSDNSYADELADVMRRWLDVYRTGGLDSWRMRYVNKSAAGLWLTSNYAIAMVMSIDSLKTSDSDLRKTLFIWYLNHLADIVPPSHRELVEREWCKHRDVDIIQEWCRANGISE